MCEEEAQLRVVWIGSVVVSVELAIRVVVASFLAVQLLGDIGKNLDNVFPKDTFFLSIFITIAIATSIKKHIIEH